MTDTDVQRARPAPPTPQRNWRDYLSPDEIETHDRLHKLVEDMRQRRRDLRKEQEAARCRYDKDKSTAIMRQIVTLDRRKRQLMAERDHIRNRGAARKVMWRKRDAIEH
jgi:hypothetical protein